VVRWATTNPSLIAPSSNPIPGIKLTPRANLDLIFGHSIILFRQQGRIAWLLVAAVVVSASLFVILLVRSIRLTPFESRQRRAPEIVDSSRQIIPVLCSWLSVYLLFLCFFEPQDPYLRLFYAPALALALGLMMSNYGFPEARQREFPSRNSSFLRTAMLGVGTLATFNFAFFIEPHMQVQSNPIVAAGRNANGVWSEQTVILYANHDEVDTTFEYFNKETKWRRLSPGSNFHDQAQTLHSEGRSVWLNRGAVESIDPDWLSRYVLGRQIKVDCDYARGVYIELLRKGDNPSRVPRTRNVNETSLQLPVVTSEKEW